MYKCIKKNIYSVYNIHNTYIHTKHYNLTSTEVLAGRPPPCRGPAPCEISPGGGPWGHGAAMGSYGFSVGKLAAELMVILGEVPPKLQMILQIFSGNN